MVNLKSIARVVGAVVIFGCAMLAQPLAAASRCYDCDILTGFFPERAICVDTAAGIHTYTRCTIYNIRSSTFCVLEGDFCYTV